MEIIELKNWENNSDDSKFTKIYSQFSELLKELRRKDLSENVIESINQDLAEVNASQTEAKQLRKLISKKQTKIIQLLEKELKITPKNYYRVQWMILGMPIFGIPFGIALGLSINNFAILAAGLPMGMGIGIALGSRMDKKAADEGRQLDFEINF
ncbi:MAG: hypothetical protein WED33_07375 [Bacteroidia bacterium]